ncbi:GHMP kinase [Ignisphaera aggregans DSM 17230]|uniref:Pantoate kinase n=1 Tax=Ignisphaera aggregans (strain DSM 17230 / JCM 13409 / AQ1.S1) TaxID=583356 RepID=E0SRY6_IGNAA|nr:GHMP kinase [Ignisphaera aggregans DSM 17230]
MKIRTRVPAGLSGFFVPHITDKLETTGAYGGGLLVDRGVELELSIDLDVDRDVRIVRNIVNGEEIDSCIARYIVDRMTREVGIDRYNITINQRVFVPIGGGYGSSGSSALAIAIAIARALKLKTTLRQIAEVAHEADIVCKTGLGTVVGLLNPCGGIVIVKRAGGPFYAEIEHIPIDNTIIALTAFYKPIPKESILSSHEELERIRIIGVKTLGRILEEPTPEVFIRECYSFAIKTGFARGYIAEILRSVNSLRGVVGASMNMIGEGIFMFVEREYINDVEEYVKKLNPRWIYIWRPINCLEIDVT